MTPATPSGWRSTLAARAQVKRRRDALGLHPARKMRLRMPDAGRDDIEFCEARLVRRTMAEVAIHGVDESLFVGHDERQKPRQAIAAGRHRRISLARKRGALYSEETCQLRG